MIIQALCSPWRSYSHSLSNTYSQTRSSPQPQPQLQPPRDTWGKAPQSD